MYTEHMPALHQVHLYDLLSVVRVGSSNIPPILSMKAARLGLLGASPQKSNVDFFYLLTFIS
jgi:hypothetical protein